MKTFGTRACAAKAVALAAAVIAMLGSGAGACGGGQAAVTGRGGFRDIHTRTGRYPGYAVKAGCQSRGEVLFVVVGTGPEWADRIEPDSRRREQALARLKDGPIARALDGIDPENYRSISWRCSGDRGLAISVSLTNYYAVDQAIAAVGEVLGQSDLREEIAIRVE